VLEIAAEDDRVVGVVGRDGDGGSGARAVLGVVLRLVGAGDGAGVKAEGSRVARADGGRAAARRHGTPGRLLGST
jgi:hypothetical protein